MTTLDACDVVLAPGEALPTDLPEGATVGLRAGVHPANWMLAGTVTLVGEDGAILDGGGSGPVISVVAARAIVTLENLTLTGGQATFGAGVRLEAYARVHLVGCTIEGNTRGRAGGAGIGARRGWLMLDRCRIDDDVVLTVTVKAEVHETAIAGGLSLFEGAHAECHGGSIDRLVLRGTTTKTPSILLLGTDVHAVENHAELPGEITRR